ncbi:MAG: DUF1573 domain-containing protein [Bacteroidota bacterium]|jgi:hypothetical protein
MRKLLNYAIILTSMLVISCGSDQTKNEKNGEVIVSPDIVNNPETANGEITDKTGVPKFDFEEITFDLGTVESGESVTHEFKFKNSGDKDLIISQAKGSCGCTQPEYPKDPVAPGDEGVIKVTFNSTGISGQITKNITLIANTTPNTKVLTITGEVIKSK